MKPTRSGVDRALLRRVARAHCLDCPSSWDHWGALACAVVHARTYNHVTEATYEACYRYSRGIKAERR